MFIRPEQQGGFPILPEELHREASHRTNEIINVSNLPLARELFYTHVINNAFQSVDEGTQLDTLQSSYVENLRIANMATQRSLAESQRFGSYFSDVQIAHAATRALLQREDKRQLTIINEIFTAHMSLTLKGLSPLRKIGATTFMPIIDKPSTIFLAQKQPNADASAHMDGYLKQHEKDVASQIDDAIDASGEKIEEIVGKVIETDYGNILALQKETVVSVARTAVKTMEIWQEGKTSDVIKHMASLLIAASNGK